MKAQLTPEMLKNIKEAVGIEQMKFKYAPAYNLFSMSREPSEFRVMCKGKVTHNEWVWLGNKKGIYKFESPAQARLFAKEIKAEAERRLEV
ncbi:hypothetical protein ACOLXF_000301 [Vibrio fluvialis]